jgi:hypothetical protein
MLARHRHEPVVTRSNGRIEAPRVIGSQEQGLRQDIITALRRISVAA